MRIHNENWTIIKRVAETGDTNTMGEYFNRLITEPPHIYLLCSGSGSRVSQKSVLINISPDEVARVEIECQLRELKAHWTIEKGLSGEKFMPLFTARKALKIVQLIALKHGLDDYLAASLKEINNSDLETVKTALWELQQMENRKPGNAGPSTC